MTIRILTAGGIGDVLLMTPALRALKAAHPDARVRVYGMTPSHVDVLRNNPHIDVLRPGPRSALGKLCVVQLRQAQGMPPQIVPRAARWLLDATRFSVSEYAGLFPSLMMRPATELIAEVLGVTLEDRRLEVYLTDEEERHARSEMSLYRRPVVIHITSACSPNQNWPIENWQALVARNPELTFIQVGSSAEPPVAGAIDLRGRTSIRESIALLKYAECFVGIVSSMAHATNAVGTPAVVLFGPSAPEVWGHANMTILTRRLRCAPCIDLLLDHPCPYGAACLTTIGVDEVERAMLERLGISASAAVGGATAPGGGAPVELPA